MSKVKRNESKSAAATNSKKAKLDDKNKDDILAEIERVDIEHKIWTNRVESEYSEGELLIINGLISYLQNKHNNKLDANMQRWYDKVDKNGNLKTEAETAWMQIKQILDYDETYPGTVVEYYYKEQPEVLRLLTGK